jgi:hypothetical protein
LSFRIDLFIIHSDLITMTMGDSLPRCDQCNSPVTDSIEVEIENHGRVKFGKYTHLLILHVRMNSRDNLEILISPHCSTDLVDFQL